jgi:hypothetical protein
VWRGAPWLGQDNDTVLGSILGYPPERISELRVAGVVGAFPPHADPAGRGAAP